MGADSKPIAAGIPPVYAWAAMEQAVIIHGWADAQAALAAARLRLTLVSAPGAGGYAGGAWFAALAALGAAAFPQVAQRWVLDCGDAAGHVLAALRAGVRAVVFTGAPELRERLASVAAACGAELLDAAPAGAAPAGAAPGVRGPEMGA